MLLTAFLSETAAPTQFANRRVTLACNLISPIPIRNDIGGAVFYGSEVVEALVQVVLEDVARRSEPRRLFELDYFLGEARFIFRGLISRCGCALRHA